MIRQNEHLLLFGKEITQKFQYNCLIQWRAVNSHDQQKKTHSNALDLDANWIVGEIDMWFGRSRKCYRTRFLFDIEH